ncbi:MAG: hypothetical protein M3511_15470, partial [Deinococcota bacterium]|nr:hypothetical protein [Deinococcota bacterium]
LWLMVITYLPGRVGIFLRYRYWKGRLKHLGVNVLIDTGIYFQNPGFISIDDNCWIDKNVIVLAGPDSSGREIIALENKAYPGEPGVVHIGKRVHVGPGCTISGIAAGVFIGDDCGVSAHTKIYAFSHHYRSKKNPSDTSVIFSPLVAHDKQCLMRGPVAIGDNTGIALNVVILPGVAIAKNCFVAINSVVFRGSYPQNSVLAGNPAKRVDDRYKVETPA